MPTPNATQILLSSIDRDFANIFGRGTHAAPVPVRSVERYQPFVRDSVPDELLVRANLPTPALTLLTGEAHVVVVVIATAGDHSAMRAGDTLCLNANDTVRLVDIVKPAQVRAR